MTNGYVADIKKAAKENKNYRNVIYTGARSQLVLMSLRRGEEIGVEVHDGDQILYIVEGDGFVVLGDKKHTVEKGSIVFVPAGVSHNVVNLDEDSLKLFTIYAPAQHAAGLVQPTKQTSEEAHFSELEAQIAE